MSFWVKASGAEMRTIAANGFVHVHFDRVLSMLTAGDLSDAQVKVGLEMARVDPTVTARPSVETVLHALTLQLEDVKFVGHTHPTDVNAILCSQRAQEAIAGRLFPDEIVTVVLPLSTSHTPILACLWLEPSAMQSTSISSSTARRPRSSSCRTTA